MSTDNKNTRTIVIVVAVLAALCLCCACLLGVGYLQRDQLGKILPKRLVGLLGLAPQAQAAQMMPVDTPIYIGVSLNLQNQAGYANIKKLYLDNPDVQDALDELKANFTDETSLDFDEDVKPWLGTEAALALPNAEELSGFGGFESPQMLLAVATRDVAASEGFLDKWRDNESDQGRPFTKDDYQGVTYWAQEAETSFDDDTYLSIFNNFVVLTNSEDALFEAIDRVKSGGKSLADNEDFQTVLDALPSNGVLFTYVDYQALKDVALQEAPMQLEPEQLSQLEAIGGVGMAMTLQPDGVQIDSAVKIDPDKLTESAQAAFDKSPNDNRILSRIPAGALAFYNGDDMNSIWQQVREALAANPDFEEQVEDFEAELGLSLDEDIFSWMTGEFAIVLTEAEPANEYDPPLGGYLLIGTDDMDLAEEKVEDIADLVSQEMYLEFTRETIGGNRMQVVFDPFTEAIMGGYGFWDDFVIIGYMEDAIQTAFDAGDDPITASERFKAVTEHLPAKNYGYFYVDVDVVQALAEGQMADYELEDYEKNVRPFIEPLRAFGVAADASSGKDIRTVTMFLLITE